MRALALSLSLTACAGSFGERGPRTKQFVTHAVANASLVCDVANTLMMRRDPVREEQNPLLGPHPSSAAVVSYFVAWGVALSALNHWAPEWVATAGNSTMIAVQSWAFYSHQRTGHYCGIGGPYGL